MHFPPKFLQKRFPPYFFRGAFAPSFIWSRRPCPLECKGNYSATSNAVGTLAVDGWAVTAAPPTPLLAIPNVTVHPSAAD